MLTFLVFKDHLRLNGEVLLILGRLRQYEGSESEHVENKVKLCLLLRSYCHQEYQGR